MKERDPKRPFTVWEWALGDTGKKNNNFNKWIRIEEKKERRKEENKRPREVENVPWGAALWAVGVGVVGCGAVSFGLWVVQ